MAELKDSGARRRFYDKNGNSMAVRDIDENKGMMYLVPLDILTDIMDYIEFQVKGETVSVNRSALFMLANKFMETNDVTNLYEAIHLYTYQAFDNDFSEAILQVSEHYRDGCNKYGPRNWMKGLPTQSFLDSALRHYVKWLRGDDDERHDRAVLWNLFGLLWTKKHHPDLDNIYYGEDYSGKAIDEYSAKWADKFNVKKESNGDNEVNNINQILEDSMKK